VQQVDRLFDALRTVQAVVASTPTAEMRIEFTFRTTDPALLLSPEVTEYLQLGMLLRACGIDTAGGQVDIATVRKSAYLLYVSEVLDALNHRQIQRVIVSPDKAIQAGAQKALRYVLQTHGHRINSKTIASANDVARMFPVPGSPADVARGGVDRGAPQALVSPGLSLNDIIDDIALYVAITKHSRNGRYCAVSSRGRAWGTSVPDSREGLNLLARAIVVYIAGEMHEDVRYWRAHFRFNPMPRDRDQFLVRRAVMAAPLPRGNMPPRQALGGIGERRQIQVNYGVAPLRNHQSIGGVQRERSEFPGLSDKETGAVNAFYATATALVVLQCDADTPRGAPGTTRRLLLEGMFGPPMCRSANRVALHSQLSARLPKHDLGEPGPLLLQAVLACPDVFPETDFTLKETAHCLACHFYHTDTTEEAVLSVCLTGKNGRHYGTEVFGTFSRFVRDVGVNKHCESCSEYALERTLTVEEAPPVAIFTICRDLRRGPFSTGLAISQKQVATPLMLQVPMGDRPPVDYRLTLLTVRCSQPKSDTKVYRRQIWKAQGKLCPARECRGRSDCVHGAWFDDAREGSNICFADAKFAEFVECTDTRQANTMAVYVKFDPAPVGGHDMDQSEDGDMDCGVASDGDGQDIDDADEAYGFGFTGAGADAEGGGSFDDDDDDDSDLVGAMS